MLAVILGVDVGSYFMNKNLMHFRNKWFYIVGDMPSILDLVQFNAIFDHKKKYVQFATFYHILLHDCLMTKFEGLKALFQLLKIKNVKRKY
jgi:hypothetical protein